MPPVVKVTRDSIIKITSDIICKEGKEAVNARRIAKELNCSVQPIFSNFENMEELLFETNKVLEQKCYDHLLNGTENSDKPYKIVGENYIGLAKNKPNLFKLLFMSKSNYDPVGIMTSNEKFYGEVEKLIMKETNLNADEAKEFHEMMWIYTHGIATLIATESSFISDDEIEKLLTNEFIALLRFKKFKEKENIKI